VVGEHKTGVDSRDKDREACWKERSVIHREDDVDGRARVIKDAERVLREG